MTESPNDNQPITNVQLVPTGKALAKRKVSLDQVRRGKRYQPLPYLPPEEIYILADAAREGRRGERDRLLVLVMFMSGLRVSEALSLRSQNISRLPNEKAVFDILGKGGKPRTVPCPAQLADGLQAYAYRHHLSASDRFFPIGRQRAWQIVKAAAKRAGLDKRIWPHLLRHSAAVYRLAKTRHPKSVQDFLGHASLEMTHRYWVTVTQAESLEIQGEVDFEGLGPD